MNNPTMSPPKKKNEEELLRDAELHMAMEGWKKAVPLLTELLERSPQNPAYNALLARALGKCSGLEKHAERQYHRALKLAPEDPEVHFGLGQLYLTVGRGARAEQEFRETLRLEPKHKGAQLELQRRRKAQGSLSNILRNMFR